MQSHTNLWLVKSFKTGYIASPDQGGETTWWLDRTLTAMILYQLWKWMGVAQRCACTAQYFFFAFPREQTEI